MIVTGYSRVELITKFVMINTVVSQPVIRSVQFALYVSPRIIHSFQKGLFDFLLIVANEKYRPMESNESADEKQNYQQKQVGGLGQYASQK